MVFYAVDIDRLKPKVGMIFDSLADVERFYKLYAHDNGFGVCVGQHKKGNEEILFKQYYCAMEGYRKESAKDVTDESKEKKEDTKCVGNQMWLSGTYCCETRE
jgi:hypothetical protein